MLIYIAWEIVKLLTAAAQSRHPFSSSVNKGDGTRTKPSFPSEAPVKCASHTGICSSVAEIMQVVLYIHAQAIRNNYMQLKITGFAL